MIHLRHTLLLTVGGRADSSADFKRYTVQLYNECEFHFTALLFTSISGSVYSMATVLALIFLF